MSVGKIFGPDSRCLEEVAPRPYPTSLPGPWSLNPNKIPTSFTWTPKECRIIAFSGCYEGFWAFILPTSGVQVNPKSHKPYQHHSRAETMPRKPKLILAQLAKPRSLLVHEVATWDKHHGSPATDHVLPCMQKEKPSQAQEVPSCRWNRVVRVDNSHSLGLSSSSSCFNMLWHAFCRLAGPLPA